MKHSNPPIPVPETPFSPGQLEQFERPSLGLDWVRMIDAIGAATGLHEDRLLAAYLHIPPSTLSTLRKGNSELSAFSKLQVLDKFGFNLVAAATEIVLSDEKKASLRRHLKKQAYKLATQKKPEQT